MFNYEFMKYAFIAGTMIGILCGLMSVFVILRRSSFAAHALGHTSLTGAAGSALVGLPGVVGQLVINAIVAILIGLFGDKIKKNDLSVGVILSFFLGLGAYFLFIFQNNYSGSVMNILFGNILSISMEQIWILLGSCVIVFIGISVLYRVFIFTTIDPELARAYQFPMKNINVYFTLLLSISVSMGCQIVGALLIFALMIIPGAIATQWCDNVFKMIFTSIIISLISIWLSLVVTFYFNIPTSFLITMILCSIYLVGYIFKIFRRTE